MNKKLIILLTLTLLYSAKALAYQTKTLEVTNWTGKPATITIEQPEGTEYTRGSEDDPIWGYTEKTIPEQKEEFTNIPSSSSKAKDKGTKSLPIILELGEVQVKWKYNNQNRETKLIKIELPSTFSAAKYPFHIDLHKDSYDIHWKPWIKKAEYGLKATKK